MKILLTALNAKFIHSSLALYSIAKYCQRYSENVEVAEYTINNEENYILSEIYKKKPDIIGLSCYIWNMQQIIALAESLKKILPDTVIVLGGPEVSYEAEEIMKKIPQADMISRGEGEKTFFELMEYWIDNKGSLEAIKGITYRKDGQIISNPTREGINLSEIPFVYTEENIKNFDNRIIYYETSRGCPYNCQYCLSSIEKGVRFLDMDRVYSDLDFFLRHNVKQVKFVDRTFNCNKKHAMAIWTYLKEHDNGVTNFHFEITADLVDDRTIEFLNTVRAGLFQFEIGVQTTNDLTTQYIKRNVDFEILSQVVKKIKKGRNIHQHLDLIAGLPGENYESFKKSFNDVYALEPEQFQLGFLKLLKGSGLRNDAVKYGLVFKDKAPYEILYTRELDYKGLLKLKMIEEMVETYYNSSKALYTIKYLIGFFESPFDFYEKLAQYWENNNLHSVQHSKAELYTILYNFSSEKLKNYTQQIKALLKYDMFLNDNLKNIPEWLNYEKPENLDISLREFYKNEENINKYLPELAEYEYRQIARMSHAEYFEYDIINWLESGVLEKKDNVILFNYHGKSYISGHAKTCNIEVI